MKMNIFTSFIILLFTLPAFGQLAEPTTRIIVKLKNDRILENFAGEKSIAGSSKIDALCLDFDGVEIQKLITGRKMTNHSYVVQFPDGTDIQQIINEFYTTGDIEYAEADAKGSTGGVAGITPTDPYYSRQWSLKNDGTFPLSPAVAGDDIDMESAWEIEQGDSTVVVAIIDTGIKLDHPDLAGRIWTNYNEIPDNGIDDDGNGYIDDVQGWDMANDDNLPKDDFGHGTNVAGIVGANGNNEIGYAGVDWNCKIMALKGLSNENWGYYSWWAAAIYYAVDNGANVINMSLGGESYSATFQEAVDYALDNNVVVVACMMNTNSNTTFYPAGFAGVIAVGATNPNDERAYPFYWSTTSGSNYGEHISVIAPGNYIYGLHYLSNTNFNTYWGGTSQATPHVAALSALLLAQNISLTPAQIKAIIELSAEDQVGDPAEDTPGWDQYYGHGRINAYNALLSVNVNEVRSDVEKIAVFPNPAQRQFTITFPAETQQIEIINLHGQVVLQKKTFNETSFSDQLSHNGTYIIHITTDKNTIAKKFVVNR
ncbi:MAG: S8 family serine peptidase [Bacteroidales bacterium]|nr:S8 family serine peptidase [Bacteroidales bacterium]